MARARPEIWKYAKQKLVCKTCESTPRPKSARPAQLPKNFEACRAVGVDVVFMPAMNVRENVPVLNMVDLATSYQMLELLFKTCTLAMCGRSLCPHGVALLGCQMSSF